jgi:hypothetical protein
MMNRSINEKSLDLVSNDSLLQWLVCDDDNAVLVQQTKRGSYVIARCVTGSDPF